MKDTSKDKALDFLDKAETIPSGTPFSEASLYKAQVFAMLAVADAIENLAAVIDAKADGTEAHPFNVLNIA